MKSFVVKETSIATEKNPSFAGQVAISYWGKKEFMLGYEGTHAEAIHYVREFDTSMAHAFGYKRRCDAKRSYTFKHPENDEFWTSNVEIIEIES